MCVIERLRNLILFLLPPFLSLSLSLSLPFSLSSNIFLIPSNILESYNVYIKTFYAFLTFRVDSASIPRE
jgi:hypothetical protein